MSRFIRTTDGGTVTAVPAPEVKVTKGGLQIRWKLPTGGKISLSEAPDRGKMDNAHYHKGLTEVYTVHEGKLLVAYGGVGITLVLLTPDSTPVFTANAGVRHTVYQFPGAVFTTQTLGEPVGNPERKNNDWYPAEPWFIQKAHEMIGAYGISLQIF